MRQLLLRAIARMAYQYREEPFTLKSGQQSHDYVDCRTMLLYPEWRALAAVLVASDLVWREFSGVAGVVLGGVPLADELSTRLHVPALYVRPEAKEHGRGRQVEKPAMWRGDSVVLVEDVVTTGGSVVRAAQALESEGITVVYIAALVDRREDSTRSLSGYPFTPIFVLDEIKRQRAELDRNG